MTRVLVGLSGGLDSTYTAYLLKKAGYQIDGFHFSNGMVSDASIETIQRSAEFLNITVKFVDIKDKFENLLNAVDIEMCNQQTPNICVMCARDIKFGYIMRYALDNGYDYLATGHYVKIIHEGNEVIVKKAIDETRDQSYGFGIIPKESLRRALTPLGDYLKVDIRQKALELGMPYIIKESRGLCFTNEPLNKLYPKITKYGLVKGNLIHHNIPTLTMPHIGQQLYVRGQKIRIGKYNCVIDKKLKNGDIILSDRETMNETQIIIEQLNFMTNDIDLSKTYNILIHYNGIPTRCRIESLIPTQIIVRTETTVYAPASGQIGTIYDDERVMVGGIITIN